MFDPVTLDQLRALVAVVEEGSFSAAARKLQRVQSAVSTSMANLESQLGVTLWDRSAKIPRLTDQGKAVLAAARRVLAEMDALKRLTAGMVQGLEPIVSLCVDALFPLPVLVDVCARFAKEFPSVDLRVDTQVLSVVSARVLAGKATLGVAGPIALPPGLERRVLSKERMLAVTGPKHALAAHKGIVPTARLADAVQIVLSERIDADAGPGVADLGVLSPRTWRVADLHTKHALLRASLGWGNLPEYLARDDVRRKRLIVIRPEPWGPADQFVELSAIFRADAVFGPAHQWLLKELSGGCAHLSDR
jgi:DNA-binding transcriptional LysR family regulator